MCNLDSLGALLPKCGKKKKKQEGKKENSSLGSRGAAGQDQATSAGPPFLAGVLGYPDPASLGSVPSQCGELLLSVPRGLCQEDLAQRSSA